MTVTVRPASEDYIAGDQTVNVLFAKDEAGAAYWVVNGSTDRGDYAHSVLDEARAKALASAVVMVLDARAKALAKYEAQLGALMGDDVEAALSAFGA